MVSRQSIDKFTYIFAFSLKFSAEVDSGVTIYGMRTTILMNILRSSCVDNRHRCENLENIQRLPHEYDRMF